MSDLTPATPEMRHVVPDEDLNRVMLDLAGRVTLMHVAPVAEQMLDEEGVLDSMARAVLVHLQNEHGHAITAVMTLDIFAEFVEQCAYVAEFFFGPIENGLGGIHE